MLTVPMMIWGQERETAGQGYDTRNLWRFEILCKLRKYFFFYYCYFGFCMSWRCVWDLGGIMRVIQSLDTPVQFDYSKLLGALKKCIR